MIKNKKKGELIIISGPSGAGKGTVIKELLKKHDDIWLSISCTSREKRSGDVPNETYYFLTKKEFEVGIEENKFLEYATYNNNYYGTPKKQIKEKLDAGINVLLEIEVQGALKVKELIPEAICIFIMPPSMQELKKRLVKRGTESKEKILSRFKSAYQEINEITNYNYVVVNDNLLDAVNKVESILTSVKCRVDRIEELDLNTIEEEIHETLIELER